MSEQKLIHLFQSGSCHVWLFPLNRIVNSVFDNVENQEKVQRLVPLLKKYSRVFLGIFNIIVQMFQTYIHVWINYCFPIALTKSRQCKLDQLTLLWRQVTDYVWLKLIGPEALLVRVNHYRLKPYLPSLKSLWAVRSWQVLFAAAVLWPTLTSELSSRGQMA